jgi:hypothetical protein
MGPNVFASDEVAPNSMHPRAHGERPCAIVVMRLVRGGGRRGSRHDDGSARAGSRPPAGRRTIGRSTVVVHGLRCAPRRALRLERSIDRRRQEPRRRIGGQERPRRGMRGEVLRCMRVCSAQDDRHSRESSDERADHGAQAVDGVDDDRVQRRVLVRGDLVGVDRTDVMTAAQHRPPDGRACQAVVADHEHIGPRNRRLGDPAKRAPVGGSRRFAGGLGTALFPLRPDPAPTLGAAPLQDEAAVLRRSSLQPPTMCGANQRVFGRGLWRERSARHAHPATVDGHGRSRPPRRAGGRHEEEYPNAAIARQASRSRIRSAHGRRERRGLYLERYSCSTEQEAGTLARLRLV